MSAKGVSAFSLTVWCLLTMTAAESSVYQKPEDGLNETVNCANDQMELIIPSVFFLSKVPPVSVWDLHLNDPECRGIEIDGNYVFRVKTNLSDCGTVTDKFDFAEREKVKLCINGEDNMHIMFINTIRNNNSDIITRSYENITFGCRYPKNYVVQQPNGENMVKVDIRTITLSTEDGNFSVALMLYKDENFKDKWTTVPFLTLEDIIYVKVFMIPAHLTLRLERCWATPTNDPSSDVEYIFIEDSCPMVANEQTLTVLRNGRAPEALFHIQMFKFVGNAYKDVFLHCNVQICHNTAGACQPNCSGEGAMARTRRDLTMSHTVSYGPIRRLMDNSNKASFNAGGLLPVETIVLGGLLFILLLVTAVFGKLWLRTRWSYPTQEAQLTLSNVHHLSEVAS